MSDLINRQDAIDAAHYYIESGYKCDIFRELKDVPSAEPERKNGHWIIQTVREYDLEYGHRIYVPEYKCSCCGHYYESYVRGDEPKMPEDADFPEYCERCGAKMEA